MWAMPVRRDVYIYPVKADKTSVKISSPAIRRYYPKLSKHKKTGNLQ